VQAGRDALEVASSARRTGERLARAEQVLDARIAQLLDRPRMSAAMQCAPPMFDSVVDAASASSTSRSARGQSTCPPAIMAHRGAFMVAEHRTASDVGATEGETNGRPHQPLGIQTIPAVGLRERDPVLEAGRRQAGTGSGIHYLAPSCPCGSTSGI